MLKQLLNNKQQEAIEYTSSPLLIVAGAGTGKTTVITEKIAYLIKNNLAKPEEILALTFTDKAAGEMVERVDETLNIGYCDLQISTFHAFCQRLLEEYGAEIGLPNRFRLLTQTDAWLMMKQNLYNFNLDYYRPLGNPAGQVHTLLDHFSKCQDELVDAKEYLDYVEDIILDKDEAEVQEKNRLVELANAYHQYNQMLLDNNCLDFGGLIFYSVKLLQTRPNILKLLQQRYKFILVDEFQDVNWAQYEFVKLMAGKSGQLTVVGDDDQAIYSFRGSNVSIIMRFMQDFPDAKEIVLAENYRSSQAILDLAYKSIANNNPNRLEEKLKINKKLISKREQEGQKKDDANIQHLHSETLDQEVGSVIKKIIAIKKDENITYDDIAILVRANSHAEPFLNALEAHGIPYEYLSSSGLYRQPVILDAISFLQILHNIHDDRAIYRLLRLSFLGCQENDLQKLTGGAKKKTISYYEALKNAREFFLSAPGIELADKLISLIHAGLQNSRIEKPTAVLYQFMEQSGYLKYLAHEENQGNREIIRQIYYLKQLFDLIRSYEDATPGSHVAGFIEHYNQIIESGDGGKLYQPEDTPDSVNILTIHSAKGLEYRHVFVVNCVEERFPTRKKGDGIELPDEFVKTKLESADFHYEEERRLFYVAVTRAKDGLYLTSASDYGGSRKKKLSRFLTELDFEDESENFKRQSSSSAMKHFDIEVIKTSNKATSNGRQAVYEPPTAFSFSQINSYERCPYQYKLAHVLKIPMKGSANFSFGNSVHNTLQKFYEQIQELNSAKQESLFGLPQDRPYSDKLSGGVKAPSLDELMKLYEESWIADWYESKKQRELYFEKGKDILKIFYKAQENNWSIPVSLEGWFKVKVGDYLINGRMDRIDKLADGSIEIIDYKTGKSKETLTSDDKQQLLIYQIAAETLPEYRNIGQVSKLTFYYINDNLRTSFLGNDQDKEKLYSKLLEAIANIRSGDFIATPEKHVCQHCDFKQICEFRKL